jgi:hypothetical protein
VKASSFGSEVFCVVGAKRDGISEPVCQTRLAALFGSFHQPAFASACFAGRRIDATAWDRLFEGRSARAVTGRAFFLVWIGFDGLHGLFLDFYGRRDTAPERKGFSSPPENQAA